MEQPPAIPPTYPHQAAANKGMPAIAWVGIGCGGLLVIVLALGTIGFFKVKKTINEFAANPEKAAAEMVVSVTPDLKVLSHDKGKGTMTIRTKEGEEMTLTYKEIAEGKFVMTNEDGTRGSSDLSQVPAWVPKAPDMTEGFSIYHVDAGNEIKGQFSGKSARSTDDLRTFFEGEASSLGFNSSSSSSTEALGTSTVTLDFSGGAKSLKVVITGKPGEHSLVNVNYSETK